MHRFALLVALLSASSPALAQAAPPESAFAPAADGQAPRVMLTDTVGLRGRPSLGDYYLREPLYAQLPEAFVQAIIAASDERKWPPGMRSEAARHRQADMLNAYVAYRVATLPDNLAVIWIPAAENQHVVKKAIPTADFFVVTVEGSYYLMADESARLLPTGAMRAAPVATAPTPPTPPPAPPAAPAASARFGAQLDVLLRALDGNFASVRGAKRPSSDAGVFGGLPQADRYDVREGLEGAKDTYLSAYGDNVTLVAEFGSFADAREADQVYAQLVANVDGAKLACCTLVKNDLVSDISVNTYYLPFGGQAAPGLDDLALELEFLKTLGRNASGDFVDHYVVTMRIKRQ